MHSKLTTLFMLFVAMFISELSFSGGYDETPLSGRQCYSTEVISGKIEEVPTTCPPRYNTCLQMRCTGGKYAKTCSSDGILECTQLEEQCKALGKTDDGDCEPCDEENLCNDGESETDKAKEKKKIGYREDRRTSKKPSKGRLPRKCFVSKGFREQTLSTYVEYANQMCTSDNRSCITLSCKSAANYKNNDDGNSYPLPNVLRECGGVSNCNKLKDLCTDHGGTAAERCKKCGKEDNCNTAASVQLDIMVPLGFFLLINFFKGP